MNPALINTVVLLFFSNLVMNVAWYGHLKWKPKWVVTAILISWGIAFFEYCLAVPANRMGNSVYSTGQLKLIQEAMSLGTFVIVSYSVLGQPVTPKVALGMVFILMGVWMVF